MRILLIASLILFLFNGSLSAQTNSVEVGPFATDYVIEDNGLPFPSNYKEWWQVGNFGGNFSVQKHIFNSDFIIIRDDLTIKKSNGFVGIGVSDPTANLHTMGSVRFQGFGSGTLTTDASGNLSVSSDARLKHLIGPYSSGIDQIMKLEPVQYRWRSETGLDTENIYTGFTAQNVREVLPEAVGQDPQGYLTLSDRPIIAALVNAVKELKAENEALKAKVDRLILNP